MNSTLARPSRATRPLARLDAQAQGAAEMSEGSKAGLVDAAHQAIKKAIRDNVFPPGYQAAEAEIARQLGMSRTPVHEAMTRLQEEGLVTILPRRGILIRALAPEDIEEIYEVIIALEGAAAERIALSPQAGRTQVVDALTAATDAMEAALRSDDLTQWAEADERFHDLLVGECGNRRLARMIGTVTDQSHRSRMLTLQLRPKPVGSAAEHRAITDAIASGDGVAANRAARLHRKNARDQIVPLIGRLNLRNL